MKQKKKKKWKEQMFQPPLNCQGTIFNLHASVEPTPKPKF